MKKMQSYFLLILFLAGCSGDGIFRNLENEEKIDNSNNLNASVSLNKILIYGDQYVTGGKRVWHKTRGTDASAWKAYPRPEGYGKSMTFPSVALLNGELYATAIDPDKGNKAGIFKYDSGDEAWEEILDLDQSNSDYYNFYLFETGQGMYVNRVRYESNGSTVSIESNQLYFYTDDAAGESDLGGGFDASDAVSLPGAADMPILEIVSGSGTATYLVFNSAGSGFDDGVLGYSAANPKAFVNEATAGSYNYTTIYYTTINGHDILLIGTHDDGDEHSLLYKVDAGTWQTQNWTSDKQFASFCNISGISANTVLGGTRAFKDPSSSKSVVGDGYREIVFNSDGSIDKIQSNDFSDENNYNSSDLEDATILDMLYDATYQRIFAATTSYGLWLNSADGSDREWTQE